MQNRQNAISHHPSPPQDSRHGADRVRAPRAQRNGQTIRALGCALLLIGAAGVPAGFAVAQSTQPVQPAPTPQATPTPQPEQPAANPPAAAPASGKTVEQITRENLRKEIARVRALLKQGAAGLAASLVESRQGDSLSDPSTWLRWERVRLEAYTQLKRYDDIVARMGAVPPGIPFEAARDFQAYSAAARIETGEPAVARDMLRALLWSGAAPAAKQALWRRLVVRSYATEGRFEDARAAMLRYQLEFRPDDDEWRGLQGRVNILAQDYETALLNLDSRKEPESRALALLAHLRARGKTPNVVIDDLDNLRKEMKTTDEAVMALIWFVRAEAAEAANNPPMRVAALEQLALVAESTDDLLIDFNLDSLWQSWLELGVAQGNIAKLLQGDDASWVKAARDFEGKSNIGARALYAWVIRNASDEVSRRVALGGLASSLASDPDGLMPIVFDIFGEGGEFDGPDRLSPGVRLALSDAALGYGNMVFAARMLDGMTRSPKADMSESDWIMRRARILILAGEFEDGASLLQGWVDQLTLIEPKRLDRVLQIVFDLQSVDEHELAMPLLRRLLNLATTDRHQREISYWSAESASGLGNEAEAAELFLRSADLAGPDGILWARSARFQAAEAMATGGMVRDARVLYEGLLKLEQEEGQRVRIERRMQQLHLIEAQQKRLRRQGG